MLGDARTAHPVGDGARYVLCPPWVSNTCLKGAAERLVPRLGRRHPNHLVFVIPNVEIEVSEELRFRQWVRRVNAEKAVGPGVLRPGRGQHLDSLPDAKTIADAWKSRRREVDIAGPPHPCPEVITEGLPGDLVRPATSLPVVARAEPLTRRPFGKVVPAVSPRLFETVVDHTVVTGRNCRSVHLP